MSLLDILTSSEIPVRTRFGRWCQKVSLALDAIGADRNPDLLEASKNAVQPGVGVGSDIVLEDLRFNSGDVSYDSSTGIATLVPGRTYRLYAALYAIAFSDGLNGELIVNWVNANTNAILNASVAGIFHPDTYTFGPNGQKPVVDAILRATLSTFRVKLRVTNATGTASISTASGLFITELR